MIDLAFYSAWLAIANIPVGLWESSNNQTEFQLSEATTQLGVKPKFVSTPVVQTRQNGSEIEEPDAVLPPVTPLFFPEECDNKAKPCVRVIGQPGELFWAIPEPTFRYWRRELSPSGANVETQIDLASSYAYQNWDTETVGADGYAIPRLGEIGIAYYIVPKCFDRDASGHFRYSAKQTVRLTGKREERTRLRCQL